MLHQRMRGMLSINRLAGLPFLLAALSGCNVQVPSLDLSVNTKPMANAGPDQNAAIGQRVTLKGLGSLDADDDSLTFIWSQRSGPAVELQDANSSQASFVPAEDGIYEFNLTVTDGNGGSDDSIVTVFVGVDNTNGGPIADAGTDQTVDERAVVTLRAGNSADPDGDVLTFRWLQLAGPDVSLSNPFATEPTFVAPEVAETTSLEFELRAEDENSNADTDSVTVTVQNFNSPDSLCSGVTCPAGQFCEAATGQCASLDLCSGVTCPGGGSCDSNSGACPQPDVDLCADVTCPPNDMCDAATGTCMSMGQNLCAGVTCPDDQGCNPTTGECGKVDCPDCPPGLACVLVGRPGGLPPVIECVDLCENVSCPEGLECDTTTGICMDDFSGIECPSGTEIDLNNGECVASGGGGTFVGINPTFGYPDAVTVDPLDPDTLLAIFRNQFTGTAVFVESTDAGNSWLQRSQVQSNLIAIDPFDTDRVFLSRFKSIDRGITWTSLDIVPDGSAVPTVTDIVFSETAPGKVFAVSNLGLYNSDDNGQAWVQINSQNVLSFAMDPFDPQLLYLGSHLGLSISRDGGATWTLPGPGLPTDRGIALIRVAPTSPPIVYVTLTVVLAEQNAAGSPQLLKSIDQGATWTAADILVNIDPVLGTGESSPPIQNILIDPRFPERLYASFDAAPTSGCGEDFTLYKSVDGGEHWNNVGNGLAFPLFDVAPSTPLRLYGSSACGAGGPAYGLQRFTDLSE